MKFILLVHHDESAFEQMSEEAQGGLLAESLRLCHQLDAKGSICMPLRFILLQQRPLCGCERARRS